MFSKIDTGKTATHYTFTISEAGFPTPTPAHIFNTLRSLNVGSPITVEGDVVAVCDHTSEIVVRSVTLRSWPGADILLDKMHGHWYAKEDLNAQFTIVGSERKNTYSGAFTGLDHLSVQEGCAGFEDSGSHLYAREEGSGESACYVINHVGDFDMTLTFLPRDNVLEYQKPE